MRRIVERLVAFPSITGLLVGVLLFAASLTPSLMPRGYAVQGLISGIAFAAGYAVGAFARWLWAYLELPALRRRRRIAIAATSSGCVALALAFLFFAAEWQNSIRSLMSLPPVDSAHPFRVVAIALPVFVALLALARLFGGVVDTVAAQLGRIVPKRVAHVVGMTAAIVLFWSIVDGVLFRTLLRTLDASWQEIDALIAPDVEAPADAARTGSKTSLLAWETLGRQGRAFVSTGPGTEDLERFLGVEAPKPIRVYVGLGAAESAQERARLALAELERAGGFERSVLIVATPTGTGWLDPNAIDPVEYLLRGDVATVGVQYSYLPSWLSLLVQPEYGAETAQAVFREIYAHWRQLPRERRPRLYLHGLSLGAMNSERSGDLHDVIADPFAGALWVGPPFRAQRWQRITAQREPGSPHWLPRFGDGSIVRFANQHDGLETPNAEWGPLRIVYLQYASDPMTFFEPQALYRKPEWLKEPRGPDVSSRLRWFPIVTVLQLAADIVYGADAPLGFGHAYAPDDYIDGWRAVVEPEGWPPAEIARLKAHFEQ